MATYSAYELLGLSAACSVEDIRAAYAKKAKFLHPDNGGSPYTWSAIQRAYDTLIDADARAEYDGQQPKEEDDGDGSGEEDASAEDASEDPWYADLSETPFDVHAALNVAADDREGNIAGGDSRLFSRFHTLAKGAWDAVRAAQFQMGAANEEEEGSEGSDDDDEEEANSGGADDEGGADEEAAHASAVLRFRRLCLAFVILRDPERRRIYSTCGFDSLRSAESYQAFSVFEIDAFRVFQSFYKGEDPFKGGEDADVRQYLLLRADDQEEDVVAVAAAQEQEGEEEEEEDHGEDEDDSEEEGDGEGNDDDDETLASIAREDAEGGRRSLEDEKIRKLLVQPPPQPPAELRDALNLPVDLLLSDGEDESGDDGTSGGYGGFADEFGRGGGEAEGEEDPLEDERVWKELRRRMRMSREKKKPRVVARARPLSGFWWRRVCSRRHARVALDKRVV